MSKTISSAVSAQLALDQKSISILIELGISSTTLYYTTNKQNIVFDGKTYTSKAINVSSVQYSSEGSLNQVTIQFDNITRDMASYANVAKFENRPIIIKRIYHGAMSGTTDYIEMFHGRMEAISDIGKYWLPVRANSGKPLYKRTLLNQYQKQCRHSFGDDYCNADGYSDLNSPSSIYSEGDVSSGATNYIVMDQTSGNTVGSNDDVFVFGQVQVGLSGVTWTRDVIGDTSSTSRIDWRVSTPSAITASYRYRAIVGCSKELSACTGTFNYGPTADNKLNFGGCLHIGENRGRTQAP